MHNALRSTLLRLLALAAMAGLAALISNGLASPARRLAWSGSVAVPRSIPATPPPAAPRTPPLPPDMPSTQATPSSHPVPQTRPITATPPAVKTPEAAASSPLREITGAEAWKAFLSGWPFLDARRSAEFGEGHIPGAWCVPVWEADLDDRLLSFKADRRPGPEDPIVIYCSGGDCKDSHLLATKLLDQGYFHLLIYRDGFPDWVAQKHPIDQGRP